MKHIIISALLLLVTMSFTVVNDACAQSQAPSAASFDKERPFRAHIYNKEYKIFIMLNAYEQDILIPGQEVFGEMAGYLKSDDDGRCWLFTSAEIAEDGKSITLGITNDYGSEDLEAVLKLEKDGSYTLKQLEGSQIKIARNKKWVKIPKTLSFVLK